MCPVGFKIKVSILRSSRRPRHDLGRVSFSEDDEGSINQIKTNALHRQVKVEFLHPRPKTQGCRALRAY